MRAFFCIFCCATHSLVQFFECTANDCTGMCTDIINLGTGVCYSPPKLNVIGFIVECEYAVATSFRRPNFLVHIFRKVGSLPLLCLCSSLWWRLLVSSRGYCIARSKWLSTRWSSNQEDASCSTG
jgi:hypothetical protein